MLQTQAGGPPDVITAADVLYDTSQHIPLLKTIAAVSAPHTETYIAYRKRSKAEEGFGALAEVRVVYCYTHTHTHTQTRSMWLTRPLMST